ncbi:MAG: D-alanyl-D-alanine carboxypeptidase [Eubacterium sp.]|nr:D-alanyl-D-alanine carboxypeptidase [Eubacterium sp.]
MKKTLRLVLIIVIILSNLLYTNKVSADDSNDDEPINGLIGQESIETTGNKIPKISAGAAIVLDTASGRVLYEKNAYTRRAIASTTKIMTAIVALENGNDEEDVLVSKRAAAIGGSTAHLKAGKTYKLKDLLYAMMLRSGNDAAIAVAEHIGGSVELFAEMMNRKAAEIGAINSNFVTPHGLDDPQHYSTPYDLALITQYALKNEKFCNIVGTKNSVFDGNNITNTNEMLSLYPGVDGVKTGYTGQAGRCLVTSATKNNWRIITVVLNCATRAVRAQNSKVLLDYTFGNYTNYEYLRKGQQLQEINVHKGLADKMAVYSDSDITIPLKQDEVDKVKIVYNLPKTLEAPVKSDTIVGSVDYILEGKVLATSDIKSLEKVGRKDFYYYFDSIFKTWARLVHN